MKTKSSTYYLAFVLIFMAFSSPLFATKLSNKDIQITILGDSEFTALGIATYQATNEIFSCTKLSWNEGSFSRIPKSISDEIDEKNGIVIIPQTPKTGKQKCEFNLVRASLAFQIKNKADPYNVIAISGVKKNLQVQEVSCREILSGPSGKSRMIDCSKKSGPIHLETDENGNAAVKIIHI